MSVLIVRLHGADIQTVELVDGTEYFAGRADDCEIHLHEEKGLSRYHLKLYQENGAWTVELLSKYGQLISNGEESHKFVLDHDKRFQVPPYEFLYQDTIEEPQEIVPPESDPEIKSTESPEPLANEKSLVMARNQSAPSNESNFNLDEDTLDGVSQLSASLEIFNPDTDESRTVRLEGSHWLAGRDERCTLRLNYKKVSRKHFELTCTGADYYIIDLGSANGTSVNGARLLANQPHELVSGDIIEIGKLKISFEVKDAQYEQRLQALPALTKIDPQAAIMAQQQQASYPQPYTYHGGGAVQVAPPHSERLSLFAKLTENKVRLILVLMAPILLYGLIFKDKKEENRKLPSQDPKQTQHPNLNKDQLRNIETSYNLAVRYLTQSKYEPCITEFDKLHSIVKQYKDSKQKEKLCHKALRDLQILENQEAERQAQEEAERRANELIAECRQLLARPRLTVDQLNSCLSEVEAINPGHPDISNLRMELDNRIKAKAEDEKNKRRWRTQVSLGEKKYNEAKASMEKGNFKEAINKYTTYLSGKYPDPMKLRPKAEREIASARSSLQAKVKDLLREAKALLDSQKLKEAIMKVDEALREDENSTDALQIRKTASQRLRKEMKELYEKSILEENLGNVNAAKALWRQITERSTKRGEGDYYNKARRKLKKYGEGVN